MNARYLFAASGTTSGVPADNAVPTCAWDETNAHGVTEDILALKERCFCGPTRTEIENNRILSRFAELLADGETWVNAFSYAKGETP